MLGEINVPNIKIQEKADNRTVFVIEPFFPGYGTTVGNALRRVLLGSLPGAAITAVKIIGVEHEFSPIPGVKEDAVTVVLNLKRLRFELHEDGPVTIKLKVTKAGPVKASDFNLPSSVELINGDEIIATVADKGKLEIEIQVGRGRGYLPSEEIDDRNFTIGTIAIDAAFSPVERVSFKVEPTRVGEMINYDRLIIDILTDGTVAPDEALKQSAQILVDQLVIFGATPSDIEVPVSAGEEGEGEGRKDFEVDELNLSARTTNALTNNGINQVSDILSLGPEKLQEMKGLGAKAIDEITTKLNELNIKFSEESQE